VDLDKALRDQVIRLTEEMQFCYDSNITPKPAKIKACKSCSLESICSKNFSEKDAASFNQKIFKEML
jgi:CRISPR/Cas system-associated exonuclease Cas4 (RecB family)